MTKRLKNSGLKKALTVGAIKTAVEDIGILSTEESEAAANDEYELWARVMREAADALVFDPNDGRAVARRLRAALKSKSLDFKRW